jgi:tryptophan halogenase
MKITIVGAGTAGLVTALILESKYQENINIKIIKSKDIDIIGVGEGSTEHWIDFMGWCGLDYNEVIRECNCTLKSGIYFKGWSKKDYLHTVHFDKKFGQEHLGYFDYVVNNGVFGKDYLSKKINPEDKTPVNQFHFDTFKLNEYLQKKCMERGITIEEDTIKQVKLNKDGIDFIKGNKKYKSDFYIDCTGFRRVLISNFKNRWIDFSKYLKVNSAIVFPTKDLNNYNPYTTATAMSSGWMFNIPVWGRHGNGYIYDSNIINETQAQEEVEKKLNHKIEVRKQIKFTPGYLDKSWIKNCFAVGLSANFVEPLEASSIGTSIQSAYLLSHYLSNYNQKTIDRYNETIEKIMLNIRDFISMHYITNRKEKFWREQKFPDSLKDRLDLFKTRLPIREDFNDTQYLLFRDPHYIVVMHGLGLINVKNIKKQYNMLAAQLKQRSRIKYKNTKNFITHKEWLTRVRHEFN